MPHVSARATARGRQHEVESDGSRRNESRRSTKKRLELLEKFKGAMVDVFVQTREAVGGLVDDLVAAGRVLLDVIIEVGAYAVTGKIDGELYGVLYQVDWNYDSEKGSALRADFLPPAGGAVGCATNGRSDCIVCKECFYQVRRKDLD